MKPTFVGIGVPRAGTTWLHELINAHPNGYTTRRRKEVHYFDRDFERGLDWYLDFFAEARPEHTVRGEFTPHYLYSHQARERIQALGIGQTIAVLRNPIDRTWSNFLFKRRQDNYQGDLDSFLVDYPEMISWSSYDEHIGPWIDDFGDNLLMMIYEHISEPGVAAAALGGFLGLDPAGFSSDAQSAKVNSTLAPRFRRIYARMVRLNKWLVSRDLDAAAKVLKRSKRAQQLLQRPDDSARTARTPAENEMLAELFAPSIERLGSMTGLNLESWSPITDKTQG